METIRDAERYHKLYIRGLITEQELTKEYGKMVLATSARVEKYMAGVTDSVYSVAYDTPSELGEHAKEMTSQLYIMWKLGLISFDDYFLETWLIENLVKNIQGDYNNWREQYKKYKK